MSRTPSVASMRSGRTASTHPSLSRHGSIRSGMSGGLMTPSARSRPPRAGADTSAQRDVLFSRLAKFRALASTPTVAVDADVMVDSIVPALPANTPIHFAAPANDNERVVVVTPAMLVTFHRDRVTNAFRRELALPLMELAHLFDSAVDEDTVYVHTAAPKRLSQRDVDIRLLRFSTADQRDRFLAHTLNLANPALLERPVDATKAGAEGAQLFSRDGLLLRSPEDVRVMLARFTKHGGLTNASAGASDAGASSTGQRHGPPLLATEHDYVHVTTTREPLCLRLKDMGDSLLLFSANANLQEKTRDLIIITDKHVHLGKQLPHKMNQLRVSLPLESITSVVLDENDPRLFLLKLDFTKASYSEDLFLIFQGENGPRLRETCVRVLQGAHEDLLVDFLPVESGNALALKRGMLEAHATRFMNRLRERTWAKLNADTADQTEESKGNTTRLQRSVNAGTCMITAPLLGAWTKQLRQYGAEVFPCQSFVYSLFVHTFDSIAMLSSSGLDSEALAFSARAIYAVAAEANATEWLLRACVEHAVAQYCPAFNTTLSGDVVKQFEMLIDGGHSQRRSATDDRTSEILQHLRLAGPADGHELLDLGRPGDFVAPTEADHFGRVPTVRAPGLLSNMLLQHHLRQSGEQYVQLALGQVVDQFLVDPDSFVALRSAEELLVWASKILHAVTSVQDGEALPTEYLVVIALLREVCTQTFNCGGKSGASIDLSSLSSPTERQPPRPESSETTDMSANALASSPGLLWPGLFTTEERDDASATTDAEAAAAKKKQSEDNPSVLVPLANEQPFVGRLLFARLLGPALQDPHAEGLVFVKPEDVQVQNLLALALCLQCALESTDAPLFSSANAHPNDHGPPHKIILPSEFAAIKAWAISQGDQVKRAFQCFQFPSLLTTQPNYSLGSSVLLGGLASTLAEGSPTALSSIWQSSSEAAARCPTEPFHGAPSDTPALQRHITTTVNLGRLNLKRVAAVCKTVAKASGALVFGGTSLSAAVGNRGVRAAAVLASAASGGGGSGAGAAGGRHVTFDEKRGSSSPRGLAGILGQLRSPVMAPSSPPPATPASPTGGSPGAPSARAVNTANVVALRFRNAALTAMKKKQESAATETATGLKAEMAKLEADLAAARREVVESQNHAAKLNEELAFLRRHKDVLRAARKADAKELQDDLREIRRLKAQHRSHSHSPAARRPKRSSSTSKAKQIADDDVSDVSPPFSPTSGEESFSDADGAGGAAPPVALSSSDTDSLLDEDTSPSTGNDAMSDTSDPLASTDDDNDEIDELLLQKLHRVATSSAQAKRARANQGVNSSSAFGSPQRENPLARRSMREPSLEPAVLTSVALRSTLSHSRSHHSYAASHHDPRLGATGGGVPSTLRGTFSVTDGSLLPGQTEALSPEKHARLIADAKYRRSRLEATGSYGVTRPIFGCPLDSYGSVLQAKTLPGDKSVSDLVTLKDTDQQQVHIDMHSI